MTLIDDLFHELQTAQDAGTPHTLTSLEQQDSGIPHPTDDRNLTKREFMGFILEPRGGFGEIEFAGQAYNQRELLQDWYFELDQAAIDGIAAQNQATPGLQIAPIEFEGRQYVGADIATDYRNYPLMAQSIWSSAIVYLPEIREARQSSEFLI